VRFVLFALLAGCSSAPPTDQAFCDYCTDDSQCGGNPCYAGSDSARYCGSPCSHCPMGASCQMVTGTRGNSVQSCVPDVGCASVHGDPSLTPIGGPVGATGGTVDRLRFGFTGDTRPDACGGAYPTAVISSIFNGLKSQNAQFVVDQGDHMFNCVSGAGAQMQMLQYTTAAHLFGQTVFMTMGNHECSGESSALCSLSSYGSNTNYTAFMNAMKPLASVPYYRFDVQTSSGLAVFVVVADDVWDATEQSWLETQLSDADAHAKYTFVSKHHPYGNMDHTEFPTIYLAVTKHKYTLFLTGHTHEFKRQTDPRAIVVGIGGAPLDFSNYWGYGIVQQNPDDTLTVTVYDQATGAAMDTFSVGPQ
jgi:hypothetical protein